MQFQNDHQLESEPNLDIYIQSTSHMTLSTFRLPLLQRKVSHTFTSYLKVFSATGGYDFPGIYNSRPKSRDRAFARARVNINLNEYNVSCWRVNSNANIVCPS